MKVEEATQTKDGTEVKILSIRCGKALGYWVDGFGIAHPAKWNSQGEPVEATIVDPSRLHDLHLDLHDWREEVPWGWLEDWVQVVAKTPRGVWYACERMPIEMENVGWLGGGTQIRLDTVKMPHGPADWRDAIAKRPE